MIMESIYVASLCRVMTGRPSDPGDTFQSAGWRTGSLSPWIFSYLVVWCSLLVEPV